MNLNELDNKNVAKRALKESFGYNFDPSNLDNLQTRNMLKRVRGLINESKHSVDFHRNQRNPMHMKLVFMEQALSYHLKNTPQPRIVFENEEVEKSQVILAAQDMVDSVQKMVEEVSDMLVKELPALVDSIQSEIGANESDQFNQQVSEALSSLNAALQQSQATLKSALGTITGQGGQEFGGELPGAETDAVDGMADMDADVDSDMGAEAPPPAPEGSDDLSGNVGRAKR
jgi:hypothetical protein